MALEETPTSPLDARRAEVAQYDANIAMYEAVIATLPSEWPIHLEQFRGRTDHQVAAGEVGLAVALPGRATAQLGGRKPLFAGLGEIGLPAFFDRTRVGQPGGIELLDIGGVGAVEKGCRFENFVGSAVQFV